MSKYSNLSVEDLFDRYVSYDEEREAIDSFAHCLPDPDQELFLGLKRRNAGALGLVPSPFDEMQNISIFKTNREQGDDFRLDFIFYDESSFEHYKAYIDDRLAIETTNPANVPYIIEAELTKCQQRLENLKRESSELLSRREFNANVAQQQTVKKLIVYLKGIDKLPRKPAPDVAIPSPKKEGKITIMAWALYYYYLQEAKVHPHFDNYPGGKVAATEEVAAKHKISAKRFQMDYNSIQQHKSERLHVSQLKNFNKVIPLLQDYPDAQRKALDELNVLKQRL